MPLTMNLYKSARVITFATWFWIDYRVNLLMWLAKLESKKASITLLKAPTGDI